MQGNAHLGFAAAAALMAGAAMAEEVKAPRIHYRVECLDKDGEVKWVEEIDNLVTNVGRADVINRYFKLSALPSAWSIGLIDNASFSAVANGDTLASHAGWLEATGYSGNRKAMTLGSVTGTTTASADNSGSVAAFAINAGATINGCFVADAATGSSGILYSAATFAAGARLVASGDTLNVTTTLTTT